MIRIANGQGFWGDWLEAPVRLVEQGPSTIWRSTTWPRSPCRFCRSRSRPTRTSATRAIFRRWSRASRRRFASAASRVIANAGGVNPVACAREVVRLAPGLKVAVVLGDDVFRASTSSSPRATRCATWIPASRSPRIRDRILSANAYIGAFPLAEALATGAQRGDRRPLHRYRADAGAHGPPLRLARGRLRQTGRRHHRRPHHRMRRAVHRRQLPGGLAEHSRTWRTSATRSWRPSPTASFCVTKHPAAGGRVSMRHREGAVALRTGRPEELHHARLRRRFHQHPAGRRRRPDRVRVTGIRGGPRPPIAEAFDQLRQRLEGHRHAGLFVAAGAGKGAGRRPHRAPAAARISG